MNDSLGMKVAQAVKVQGGDLAVYLGIETRRDLAILSSCSEDRAAVGSLGVT